jgi:hypothetical protein
MWGATMLSFIIENFGVIMVSLTFLDVAAIGLIIAYA